MNSCEFVPLSQHDILDRGECETIRDAVLALQSCWTSRAGGGFFTLGAASYIDATQDRAEYAEQAKKANPILHQQFGWLHEHVRSFFEELLEDRVFYSGEHALPGFHIFKLAGEDRSGDNAAMRAHFDLQWMHAVAGQQPAGTVSFTLPVAVPSGGSSMEIWPIRYHEAVQLRFTAIDYASKHPSQIVRYVPGRVVIHDGLILHAIGRAFSPTPKGFRITLQGHGVKLPEGWMLYW
jgi:hypothetical protein